MPRIPGGPAKPTGPHQPGITPRPKPRPWKKGLKPGGKILGPDGNWLLHSPIEESAATGHAELHNRESEDCCHCTKPCCMPDGACRADYTVQQCLDLDGTPIVDAACGDTCEDPIEIDCCPLPCCLPDGTCRDGIDSERCTALGGQVMGSPPEDCGTLCGDVDCCPRPCCWPDGTCQNAVSAADCIAGGGRPQGGCEDSCADVDCCPKPCCIDDECYQFMSQEDCLAAGGHQVGECFDTCQGVDCCPKPCCIGDKCQPDMYREDCIAAGGIPIGECFDPCDIIACDCDCAGGMANTIRVTISGILYDCTFLSWINKCERPGLYCYSYHQSVGSAVINRTHTLTRSQYPGGPLTGCGYTYQNADSLLHRSYGEECGGYHYECYPHSSETWMDFDIGAHFDIDHIVVQLGLYLGEGRIDLPVGYPCRGTWSFTGYSPKPYACVDAVFVEGQSTHGTGRYGGADGTFSITVDAS